MAWANDTQQQVWSARIMSPCITIQLTDMADNIQYDQYEMGSYVCTCIHIESCIAYIFMSIHIYDTHTHTRARTHTHTVTINIKKYTMQVTSLISYIKEKKIELLLWRTVEVQYMRKTKNSDMLVSHKLVLHTAVEQFS